MPRQTHKFPMLHFQSWLFKARQKEAGRPSGTHDIRYQELSNNSKQMMGDNFVVYNLDGFVEACKKLL